MNYVRELSLFTGAGGGLLGTKLLGFRPIGYVECDGYCQAVIAQRIKDGFLEEAPIFGDIREFVKSGAAREYRGFADVVTAGFPCQPFSVAGKQAAEDDPRNMWPATADVLREVRPDCALLENVPGLLATGYCERIFGDLAALGFDARWGVFSAAGSGAPHLRERFFILAHAAQQFSNGGNDYAGECMGGSIPKPRDSGWSSDVADTERHGLQGKRDRGGADGPHKTLSRSEASRGSDAPDAADSRLPEAARLTEHSWQIHAGTRPARPDGRGSSGWWAVEPRLGRVADGVAHRLERLRANGNGQVPAVVARAWTMLNDL